MTTAESVMEQVAADGAMEGAVTEVMEPVEVVEAVDPAQEAQSAFYPMRAVVATDGLARALQESLQRRW